MDIEKNINLEQLTEYRGRTSSSGAFHEHLNNYR